MLLIQTLLFCGSSRYIREKDHTLNAPLEGATQSELVAVVVPGWTQSSTGGQSI
jgi:hypothetical protein